MTYNVLMGTLNPTHSLTTHLIPTNTTAAVHWLYMWYYAGANLHRERGRGQRAVQGDWQAGDAHRHDRDAQPETASDRVVFHQHLPLP